MQPKFYFPAILLLFILYSCSVQNNPEREVSFYKNWKFIRSDVQNGQAVGFSDSGWRMVDLPHDYSIEDLPENDSVKQIGPFSEESAGGASTGHVVGGTAWYRKHFSLNKEDKGKIIQVLFDGIYMNADIWINGNHLGNHPYGYTPFTYDLSPFLNPAGQDNVLAVQVKNEGKNSRWYSGSGIYRDVTMIKTNPLHIELWGTHISTPEISEEKAKILTEISVKNESKKEETFVLNLEIKDPAGQSVTQFSNEKKLAAGEKFVYNKDFEFSEYRLWSVDNPELYTLVVQLKNGQGILDETRQKFGIRSLEFSPEKGFLLNGENIYLKGGCLHHDNGPLGSAAFKTAEYRRVKNMKENGFNAIRTAHNPPSKIFLDACDELGMLVLDEAFDQWQRPKNPQDYHLYFDDWWEKDLESMVLRDRNHPSVIIWSIGNEINERADSSGLEIAKKLKTKIKSMDTSRPVTQAICSFWDHRGYKWDNSAPAFAQMDVDGYNYLWNEYEPDHEKYPGRIIIGTESFPMEAFENWQMVEKHPYVIGDFVWTGMDYLGESGIGNSRLDNEGGGFLPPWPWFNSYCGDISILGYKKPQMFYRDVVWGNSELEMQVHAPVPEGRKEIVSRWGWPEEWKSWNWEGNEGIPLLVSVYTRCEQVRLELNGQVIGTKDVSDGTKLTAQFEVPYQPGELTAIGLIGGNEIVRQSLKTAGKPELVKITAENETVNPSEDDLVYFNVEIQDDNGNLVPDSEVPVEFDIQGDCKLQAVGNGNPRDMKSFKQPHVKAFRGKCQLIVRLSDNANEIKVTAKSDGLKPGNVTVKVL